MAKLFLGSFESDCGVYTVIDERTQCLLVNGQPIVGMVATFYDPNRAEDWWSRVMTGTVEDMWQWLYGHEVETLDIAVPIPFISGGYSQWGDRWRLSPRQVVAMFELGRVPSEALLGAN